MKLRHLFTSTAILAFGFSFAHAADLTGKWTSDFDSQIGPQKYVYTFKTDAGKTTGKATYDHQMGKGDSELKDIKVEKDDVSFVETVHINDMDLVINYTGKLTGDEMKLHRVVGDYGSEDIVAKRVKTDAAAEAKPAAAK